MKVKHRKRPTEPKARPTVVMLAVPDELYGKLFPLADRYKVSGSEVAKRLLAGILKRPQLIPDIMLGE